MLWAGTMRGRRVLSAILVVLPAIVRVATYRSTLKAASDASDCKAKPNSAPPVGSRWQYHINRVDHRHCWFLTAKSLVAHTRMSPASRRGHRVNAPDANAGPNAPRGGQVTPEVASTQPAKIESAAASEQSTASEHQPLLVDAPTSDDLIPKMVTSITYSAHSAPEASPPPAGPLPEVKRAGAQSVPRGGGTDLMFLGGALATAVLVAGLVFQIIGRLRQVRLTHSHHDAGAGIAQSVEEAVPVSSPTRSNPSDMQLCGAIRPMTSSRRWTNGYLTCKNREHVFRPSRLRVPPRLSLPSWRTDRLSSPAHQLA